MPALLCLLVGLVVTPADGGVLTGAPALRIAVPDSAGRSGLTCNGRSDCRALPSPSSRRAPASLRRSLRRAGLTVRYLGCGGVYLERCVGADCHALLMAPFFSQRGLLTVGFSDTPPVRAGVSPAAACTARTPPTAR